MALQKLNIKYFYSTYDLNIILELTFFHSDTLGSSCLTRVPLHQWIFRKQKSLDYTEKQNWERGENSPGQ